MATSWLVGGTVLGSALLHATWNALVKSDADRLVTLCTVSTVWLLAGGALAAVLPFPAAASWPYLLTSIAVHQVYLLGLLWMYRSGDLSRVYPIARGSAPLLLAVGSAALAGEHLAAAQWTGVAAVSAGILSLAAQGGRPSVAERGSLAAALLTGAVIACYTLADGLGVRLTELPLGYSAWLHLGQGAPWVAVLAWLRLRDPDRVPLRALSPGALAGALSMTAYALVIWALSQAEMAPISALRETSVIFAAMIGSLVLGEPFGRQRVVAAVLVAAGVTVLMLASG